MPPQIMSGRTRAPGAPLKPNSMKNVTSMYSLLSAGF
jgi:hypothetical protein